VAIVAAGDETRRSFYDGMSLHIRIYDSIDHGGRPVLQGDIAFYLDLAQRANGHVLEIGVRTGRVAVELADGAVDPPPRRGRGKTSMPLSIASNFNRHCLFG
jgi:hypothetical protein